MVNAVYLLLICDLEFTLSYEIAWSTEQVSLHSFGVYYCSTTVPLLLETEGDKVTLIYSAEQ